MSDYPRFINATLSRSVHNRSQLLPSLMPEIVIAGRSNVGKSSLINKLAGQKSLARVSSTPGRTQALFFFTVQYRTEELDSTFFLVDVPGYGYAKVPARASRGWGELLSLFFTKRPSIANTLILVDSRREWREEEQQMLDLVGDSRATIVLTKCDQVSRNELAAQIKKISADSGISPEFIIATSTDKNIGIQTLREHIVRCLVDQS